MIGEPKVPVEFRLVGSITAGTGETVGLFACPVCMAVITREGSQPHAEWHRGERVRTMFGGL